MENNPTIKNKKTEFGKLNEPKSFSSQLSELDDNTEYFVRAYTTYQYGTVYGKEEKIRTLKTGQPVVNTLVISQIDAYSAECKGKVAADSGLFVIARGMCWDTTQIFSLSNSIDTTISGSGKGNFISKVTGLNENVKYYIKAYAINEKGTSFGELKEFKTIPIMLANVETIEVTEITLNSAQSGGNILSNGNGTIESRGVCWNITGNPTLENCESFTEDGVGTGTYISYVNGLTGYTTYYIAAYATNDKGTSYGEVIQFSSTPIVLPEITIAEVIEVDYISAKSGGDVINEGNGTVTARGVCWNINGNPTLQNNLGYTVDGEGDGNFVSNIINLTENTTYSISAYATNEKGTGYGEIKSFSTLNDPCDGLTSIIYEGQEYKLVSIGEQCWFKENLNYVAGDSWCYNNDPAMCEKYGRLYEWNSIMSGASSSNTVPSGVRGICPQGWHIPSDAEWKILEGFVDSQYGIGSSEWSRDGLRGFDAGKRLKSTSGWGENNGTDEVDFKALPGGFRYSSDFYSLYNVGYWWTSTESGTWDAIYRDIRYADQIGRGDILKDDRAGNSVRCIKDWELQ